MKTRTSFGYNIWSKFVFKLVGLSSKITPKSLKLDLRKISCKGSGWYFSVFPFINISHVFPRFKLVRLSFAHSIIGSTSISLSAWINLATTGILKEMSSAYLTKEITRWIYIRYFTVGERVRFLYTSCIKQTNERSEWICFTQRVNKNRRSELTVK